MEIQPEQPLLTENLEEPYTLENLPVYISIEDATVSIFSNILQVTSDGFTFLQEKPNDQWFSISTSFANTNSVGMSGNNLLVFVGDQEVEEEEQVPQILNIISASPAGGNVQLNGHCFTISIDFGKQGKNVMKQVHDIFVNYMGDADEHVNRYDEDENLEEMIFAEDIDGNGNIINKEPNESSEELSEEEEEQTKQKQIKNE